MKKIYLLLSAALIASASFAQYKTGNGPTAFQIKNLTPKVNQTPNNKAAGDSLVYFDSEGFYLVDPADQTDFALTNEDIDGSTPAQSGWPSDFIFSFINTDPAETPYTSPGGDFFPYDITPGTDTAWFIGASSWFTTPATANNWWNFGPITIPAGSTGNTFNWYDQSNPQWTDSYNLYVISMTNVADPTAPSGIVDIIANGVAPLYSRAQIAGSPSQPAADTSWALRTVNIDAFAGQRVFIYFNHNANDGDALFLDEMFVVEGTTSIEELNSLSFNVFPNPSKGEFNINLSSKNSENVNLSVKNVVGQTIINKTIAVNGKSKETISLANYSKGIYFLTVDNKTTKLIVE